MTRIDGHDTGGSGSVLDAVRALGIALPSLCKDDNLPALGACRTCLVEADGRIVASCTTPLDSVTEVSTTSERVVAIRDGVLRLTAGMISDPSAPGGPHSRELAAALGDAIQAGGDATGTIDGSNAFFEFHESECILCGRCATACQDLQHIGAIAIAGHGRHARVTPGAGVSFAESICTSCGSCVAACPTPALRPKVV